MAAFPWQCPYCGHHSSIGNDNYAFFTEWINKNSVDGQLVLVTRVIVCPNPVCKQYEIGTVLRKHAGWHHDDSLKLSGEVLQSWALRPQSSARPMPGYIPQAIIDDYTEACLIRDLSPKASATLARRCLQGMIRDFYKVKPGRLVDEIAAIKDKVDPVTWDSVEAVRKIGNIGAHMEKDIDLIVDVEPEEAGLLIGLIESLIDDWYVARYERAQRHATLQATAAQKEAARKGQPTEGANKTS
ncbi:DUF4145 domain-containing protein [Ralstonia insidiosa]|uniref:DUF4145 domain-containing protein n=1 Tax=Ralstonia insidiosa TaxID=190721 RepID=UPI000CEE0AE8|nr:DUF4145 domain-containing protein [Ralstonia insidiosa]